MMVALKKLGSRTYQTVERFRRYPHSFIHNITVWWTDGQRELL